MTAPPWWQGAVIYQVYPLSFQDSNGDGIGDLPGVISRLDHIAELGVDAVWLSPFYRSPLDDFGYDVADHTAVDPVFGTLEDFDRLIAEAHGRGLKVMIDLVLSHTSDRHAWFEESRRSRTNPYADWYVWADPRPDGAPPNNWLSEFGGSAWRWGPERGQYYLHNFLASQPDLNFHNPEVQRAQLQVARFWLDRGVDGFRLDALHCLVHDARLRNNPPRPLGVEPPPARRFKPKLWQLERYNAYRPQVVDFIKQLRALVQPYGAVTLAEVGEADGAHTSAEYIRGRRRLHMAYNFTLLGQRFDAARIKDTLAAFREEGWFCMSVGNHDVARPASRLREALGEVAPLERAVMLPALLASLRGASTLYQGDELGLPQPEVPHARMRDPYGLTFHPVATGRDGARTPMPWSAEAPHGGFSSHPPWMPMPDEHLPLAVDQQRAAGAPMQRIGAFLRWRRQHPALRTGALTFIDMPAPILAFERRAADRVIRVAFNLSGERRRVSVGEGWAGLTPLPGHGLGGALKGEQLLLPGYGAWFGSAQHPDP